jgi:parallel beta-helix repeat protein
LEARALLSSTYYIATTGSDTTGDGSAAHPFATIQHGANLAQPGDTVDVEPGQYAGFVLGWDFPQGGTASAPITYRAEPGAIITSKNIHTADGIDLEPGCPYVNIYGFTVNNADASITRAGIRVTGSDHVNVVGNTATNNGTWGIFTAFSNYTLIQNNIASNSRSQHGIYVSNSPDHVSVIGNTAFGNVGCGIQFNGDLSQGGTGLASNELVENNMIYSNGVNGGSAINCDGLVNSVIENNLLYNNHASGISLFQIDGATGSTNNVVVNNTIVMPSDARWAININTGSTGNILFNNILFNENPNHGDILIDSSSLSGFKSDYNVLAGREDVGDGSSFENLSSWRAQTGQDTHSIQSTEAAVFVNSAGGNYQLANNSPAIKAGVSSFAGQAAPTTDIQGNTRPTSGWVDIGAYSFTSNVTAPTANSQSVTTNQNTPVNITLTGTDPNSPPRSLTYTVTVNPAHGALAGTAPNLTYTPNSGYIGSDSFQFKNNNGTYDSNIATVSITVVGAPTANNQSVSVNQNTAVAITLTGSDPNTPARPLTFTLTANPAHGTLSGTAPNLTYTPAAGYLGSDSFQFKDNNGALDSNIATVSITVSNGQTVPNIAGTWFINGTQTTQIQQNGSTLTFINENGQSSPGLFQSPTQVVATGWGNLTGTLVSIDDGTRINWSNGTAWSQPELAGQGFIGTRTVQIAQNGNNLTFTNENGGTSAGYIADATHVVATSWGNLVGTLTATFEGYRINWANGTAWDMLRLAGTWFINGSQTAQVVQPSSGTALTFINENGASSPGFIQDTTHVVATGWGNLVGTLVAITGGQIEINWSNGTAWVKPQLAQ